MCRILVSKLINVCVCVETGGTVVERKLCLTFKTADS